VRWYAWCNVTDRYTASDGCIRPQCASVVPDPHFRAVKVSASRTRKSRLRGVNLALLHVKLG